MTTPTPLLPLSMRRLPVLACRCGAPLRPQDMHWLPPRTGDGTPLRRVVCAGCADRNRSW